MQLRSHSTSRLSPSYSHDFSIILLSDLFSNYCSQIFSPLLLSDLLSITAPTSVSSVLLQAPLSKQNGSLSRQHASGSAVRSNWRSRTTGRVAFPMPCLQNDVCSRSSTSIPRAFFFTDDPWSRRAHLYRPSKQRWFTSPCQNLPLGHMSASLLCETRSCIPQAAVQISGS